MFELLDERSAYEARIDGLKLAFAPMMFQAAKVARDNGLLEALDHREEGVKAWQWYTLEALAKATKLSSYALRVLLDAALALGLVQMRDEQYRLTQMGHFMLHDKLTRINMDFVHDVCYQGMFHLDEAIANGTPAGLKTLGDWPTVYEGLASLPPDVRASWLHFDHYYSDQSFPQVVKMIFEQPVKHLVDIGGNTGKWTRLCLEHDPQVHVTIVDLPGQLESARQHLEPLGLMDRVTLHPANLLDKNAALPTDADVVWMSQFLCCFSEPEIVTILNNVKSSLAKDGRACILETFWDEQKYDIAAHCLIATSLYFTCIANGNSRIYRSADMVQCVHDANMQVISQQAGLGMGHTLLQCR